MIIEFIIIVFAVSGAVGLVVGLVAESATHKRYKLSHSKEEYRDWTRNRAKANRDKRKAYWNSPMTRADWYIWHLFRK